MTRERAKTEPRLEAMGGGGWPEQEEMTAIGPSAVKRHIRSFRRPFVLQLVTGPGAPQDFILDQDEVLVGRGTSCAVSVDSALLSRRHLKLTRRAAEYRAEDLNSANGVLLNGLRIHSAILRDGDTLQCGDILFLYLEGR